MAIRNAGDEVPAGIIAICPFADLTLKGPSVRQFDGKDPAANRDTLTFWGASYFQRHDPHDPMVSPIFGDFRGLPPMFLAASEGEVLFNDTTRVAERAAAAGVEVTMKNVTDSVHVFVVFPFLPETASTLAEIKKWSLTLGSAEAISNEASRETPRRVFQAA